MDIGDINQSNPVTRTFRCVCNNKMPECVQNGSLSFCNAPICFQSYIHDRHNGDFSLHKGCYAANVLCMSDKKMNAMKISCCAADLCNLEDIDKCAVGLCDDSDIFGHLPSTIWAPLVAVFCVIIIVAIAFSMKRRLPGLRTIMDAHSDTLDKINGLKTSLLDLSQASSGSGGHPGLQQRTVAQEITLVELIGKGGFSEVWTGLYKEKVVAVKIIKTLDEKSWERESRIFSAAMMSHENILMYIASDVRSIQGDPQMWLITQYHPNGSLFDYLHNHKLSPKIMLQLAHSAASGLVHLHQEVHGKDYKPAIAHCDIKTKNILVKNDHTSCISDFNLSVMYSEKTCTMDIGAHAPFGTRRYMAPEMIDGTILLVAFDSFKKLDMYSFGLVLWELGKRCDIQGEVESYRMPYEDMVPNDPSIEDMKSVVCDQQLRPPIPDWWDSDEMMKHYGRMVRECWNGRPTCRLTMLRVRKNLDNMLSSLHRPYSSHDPLFV